MANLAKTAKMGEKVKSWKTEIWAFSADLSKLGFFQERGNKLSREILLVGITWKQDTGKQKSLDFRFYRMKTDPILVLQVKNPVQWDHRVVKNMEGDTVL